MPVSADLGPLAAVLEHAGRPQAADRSTAAELGRALVRVAEKLPRPAPIPILVTAPIVDDTSRLRRPNDPTGGVARPEPEPAAPIVPPPPPPVTGTVVPVLPTPPPPPPAPPAPDPPPDQTREDPAPDGAATDVIVDESGTERAAESPAVYDGDTDATKDELAVLARTPATATLVAEREPEPDLVVPPPDAGDPGAAPAAAPDAPRSRWFIALIAFLVLAALAALAFLASVLFRVPSHEVPDLAGLDVEQAQAEIADFDWEVQLERQRSDEEPDVGQVVRSVPPAGFDLGEGEPFLLIVSDGPELRTLPELGGVALAEAETTLAELRLRATTVAEEHHEDIPAGSVISWAVAADPTLTAGAEVLPDTEVGLVVSLGPAPRTVPDVANLTVADATAQLEALRLEVELAPPEFDNDIPAGAVIASDPEPGASLERGSTVTLRTSKGPDLVTLPDLVGLGLAEARARLAEAGLQAGAVIGNTQGAVVQMLVANRSVEAGTQYLRNSVVDLALI
jgi:serine/threonine-protein kinase